MSLPLLARFAAFVEDRPATTVLGLVTTLSVVRVILLVFYQSGLGPDEAQYWFWGQTLDWGYYSKPPMIAWVIAIPTRIFGDHEWAVRLLSPVFIGGAGFLLFSAARRLYGDRVGVWAAGLWLSLPVVMFGATIMSTDIPLLLFWSLGLYALIGLAEAPAYARGRWAALLGGAIGLGLLSKYAMVYFVLGWGLSLCISPYARRTLSGGALAIVTAVAAIVFAPNLLWNAKNGFQTLSHTADNANWGAELLNPEELGQFLGDQFGVIGPFLFLALIFGCVTLGRRLRQAEGEASKDLLLLSFIVPPLLIISVQALISRAHANWAMTAYPAAMILLPVWLIRLRARWVLWSSIALHASAGVVFTAGLLSFSFADQLGLSNAVKRLRGWTEQTEQLRAASKGLDGLIVDEREIAAHLVWEMRDAPFPLFVFDMNGHKDNTYEHVFPFTVDREKRYLIATQNLRFLCRYDVFANLIPKGESFVDLNAIRHDRPERLIYLYEASDYQAKGEETCPSIRETNAS
ncbi:MAG: glycosyltransferase family 39 protein [Pseudomonadota bacterium]